MLFGLYFVTINNHTPYLPFIKQKQQKQNTEEGCNRPNHFRSEKTHFHLLLRVSTNLVSSKAENAKALKAKLEGMAGGFMQILPNKLSISRRLPWGGLFPEC